MKLLFTLLLMSFFSVANASTCNSMVYSGLYPAARRPTTIICHRRMVIGFSPVLGTPLWVAEELTAAEVKGEHVKRKDDFRPDPAIPSNQQGTLKEYVKSGYDRGHMNNFKDVADDPIAADESFFMTNMVPQVPENNRVAWRSVEEDVRKIALYEGNIFVITGPIFSGKFGHLKDGTLIPTYLYKVVYSPTDNKVWVIILPNQIISIKLIHNYMSSLNVLNTLYSIDALPGLKAPAIEQSSFILPAAHH